MSPRRSVLAPALLLALGALVTGCGDDGGADPPTEPPAQPPAAGSADPSTPTEGTAAAVDVPDEADAELTVKAWFEARRTGDTATICAFESEDYQVFQYGDPAGCADDAANQQPQSVWAEDVPVTSVTVDDAAGTAQATVTPNAGDTVTEATVGLVALDGEWLVASFA
jgi:hypothetical protein